MTHIFSTTSVAGGFPKAEELSPSGGLERLAAAGVPLTNAEVDRALRINAEIVDPRWAHMVAWPVARDCNGDLIWAGACPFCHRVHAHGGDAALKLPHC